MKFSYLEIDQKQFTLFWFGCWLLDLKRFKRREDWTIFSIFELPRVSTCNSYFIHIFLKSKSLLSPRRLKKPPPLHISIRIFFTVFVSMSVRLSICYRILWRSYFLDRTSYCYFSSKFSPMSFRYLVPLYFVICILSATPFKFHLRSRNIALPLFPDKIYVCWCATL